MGKEKKKQSLASQMWALLFLVIIGLVAYGASQNTPVRNEDVASVTIAASPEVTEEIAMNQYMRAFQGTNLTIISADEFALAQRVQVVWRTGQDVTLIQREIGVIVCAVRGSIPAGYGLRIGGKLANDITVITATISSNTLATIDCGNPPADWSVLADEWSLASGL